MLQLQLNKTFNIKISFLGQFIFMLLINLYTIKGYSQDAVHIGGIKGLVMDNVTLQPVPFCNVYIKEINIGTISNEDGHFYLENIPEGRYSLIFSFVGYQEKIISEIRVVRDKTSFIEVKLLENVFSLDAAEITTYRYEQISSMPTGTFSLSREEIYRSPASNGNIFKAISVIPGVQSGGGSFSALAVRGQGTEENVTYVDGFPIFELSHLAGGAGSGISGGFDDPNGGRFSIFGPKVIDGLVLQTGGFSSLYGRKSSSYLELDVKSGNPENSEIDALISLTGASISYSGPTFHKKTTLFTSLRYQNFVPALNLTQQGELGSPSFLDLTLKSETHLNKKNKLTVLALFNPEWFIRNTTHIAKDDKLENVVIADVGNSKGLVGLKLRTLLNDNSNWVNLTYFRFKNTNLKFGKAYPEFNSDGSLPNANEIKFNDNKGKFNNKESEIGFRSVYTLNTSNTSTFQAGTDIARIHINHSRILTAKDTIYSFYRSELPFNQQNQNFAIVEPANFNAVLLDNKINFSAFTNFQFTPVKKLIINAGVRYDYTGFSKSGKISPRLSFSYKINEKSSVNVSTGIFYQDPLFVQVADNSGIVLEPERALHYIIGFKHYFTKTLKLTIESYYKDFKNLIIRPNSFINKLTNQGEGFAYGIDFSLVKRLSNKYNGILSYSYSQSKRNNNDGIGQYNHLYSQPHIFNFLLSYQPNPKWTFSGKFRYSTGQPTNSDLVSADVFGTPNFLRFSQELTGRNNIRNDDFIGIDLRIDNRFQYDKYALSLYLDIQNVTNRTNAATRTFFETTGNFRPEALGILPTIGIQFEF